MENNLSCFSHFVAALGSNLEQGLKAVFIYWTKKGCNDRDTDHYDNEVHFKREP